MKLETVGYDCVLMSVGTKLGLNWVNNNVGLKGGWRGLKSEERRTEKKSEAKLFPIPHPPKKLKSENNADYHHRRDRDW